MWWVVTLAVFISFLAGLKVGSLPPGTDPNLLDEKSRIFPYLYLLRAKPEEWDEVPVNYNSWEFVIKHPSGRTITLDTRDNDIKTDRFSDWNRLSTGEKTKIRKELHQSRSNKLLLEDFDG